MGVAIMSPIQILTCAMHPTMRHAQYDLIAGLSVGFMVSESFSYWICRESVGHEYGVHSHIGGTAALFHRVMHDL